MAVPQSGVTGMRILYTFLSVTRLVDYFGSSAECCSQNLFFSRRLLTNGSVVLYTVYHVRCIWCTFADSYHLRTCYISNSTKIIYFGTSIFAISHRPKRESTVDRCGRCVGGLFKLESAADARFQTHQDPVLNQPTGITFTKCLPMVEYDNKRFWKIRVRCFSPI